LVKLSALEPYVMDLVIKVNDHIMSTNDKFENRVGQMQSSIIENHNQAERRYQEMQAKGGF
jgi:hypothetical protein